MVRLTFIYRCRYILATIVLWLVSVFATSLSLATFCHHTFWHHALLFACSLSRCSFLLPLLSLHARVGFVPSAIINVFFGNRVHTFALTVLYSMSGSCHNYQFYWLLALSSIFLGGSITIMWLDGWVSVIEAFVLFLVTCYLFFLYLSFYFLCLSL